MPVQLKLSSSKRIQVALNTEVSGKQPLLDVARRDPGMRTVRSSPESGRRALQAAAPAAAWIAPPSPLKLPEDSKIQTIESAHHKSTQGLLILLEVLRTS